MATVKEEDRQRISDDTEVFLRKGGTVSQCGPEDNAAARFVPARTRVQALRDMKKRNYRDATGGQVARSQAPKVPA